MKTVDMCLGQTKGEKQVTVLRILLLISFKNVKWFYLVILLLSGLLMSDCSLKPTNNADWKVPLAQSTLHCCP